MKRVIIILFTCNFFYVVNAQQDTAFLKIVQAEAQLKLMFDQLYDEQVPGSQIELFHDIDSVFNNALHLPGSFEHSWTKLEQVGRLVSDDGVLKVFSWLYMLGPDEYQYSGFLQLRDKNETEVFRLQPVNDENRHAPDFNQEPDRWDGKAYYNLVTKKYKRKTLYTLIGVDFHNSSTSIKTIEVLGIQRGKPFFRDDQFLLKGTVEDRMVLEYSSEVAATVRYNSDLDMIVFDHLVPLHPLYHGNFQFYGPDGSYDGLRFEEGMWIFEEDVDARNDD